MLPANKCISWVWCFLTVQWWPGRVGEDIWSRGGRPTSCFTPAKASGPPAHPRGIGHPPSGSRTDLDFGSPLKPGVHGGEWLSFLEGYRISVSADWMVFLRNKPYSCSMGSPFHCGQAWPRLSETLLRHLACILFIFQREEYLADPQTKHICCC